LEAFLTRILVADDNAAVRRYLRGLLEQQDGWEVCEEARNGPEAVSRFRESGPDLIVLDFQMPDMNGLETARQIMRENPAIPILMVSLFLSKQLTQEAQRAGIKGACAKTDISSVVEAIEALLRKENYFPN
jgi:DNA-binding NarL/FixJ family response regulator